MNVFYISTSTDGLTWQAPKWWRSRLATGRIGPAFNNVVRDPAIIFDNGWYWVAYTSGNYGQHQSFGLVKSTDLTNWQYVDEVSAVRPGAGLGSIDVETRFGFRDSDNSIHLSISLNLGGFRL